MRVFVNELALQDACSAANPQHAPLEELLRIRQRSEPIRRALYCSGNLSVLEIRPGVVLSAVAQRMPRERLSLFMRWIAKQGPFIETDRQSAQDDLFYFEDIEVTELGLGEAARWILAARRAAVLSVVGGAAPRFAKSSLEVLHGSPEEPRDHLAVPNYWAAEELDAVLQAELPDPATWSEFLSRCRTRYDRLLISVHCDARLKSRPYARSLGRAIKRRLQVLQELMCNMNSDGSLSADGRELLDQYFKGQHARFTDESHTRKQTHPERFRFPDPDGDGALVCTWHGKVSPQSFRIYFEWPVPPPRRILKICYIGPHL